MTTTTERYCNIQQSRPASDEQKTWYVHAVGFGLCKQSLTKDEVDKMGKGKKLSPSVRRLLTTAAFTDRAWRGRGYLVLCRTLLESLSGTFL